MTHILACIDSADTSPAVCDYAAWASLNFVLPLTLLNVVDRPAGEEIRPASLAHVLEALSMDEKRHDLALKQGLIMLQNARERAIADGVKQPELRQNDGELLSRLLEMETDMRWIVMGRHSSICPRLNQLETIIHALHKPILVTPSSFNPPRSLMLAYDGSEETHMGVEMLAASPALTKLPVHLVMIAAKTSKNLERLDAAEAILQSAGCDVRTAIRGGRVELALQSYQTEHDIGLMIMGAFGHSRVRRFWLGSTTSRMIRAATRPLLFLPKSYLNM
ncbi:Universal stress protein family protein [compost metagenome]|uniref:universal stress protein n=1 Tax=Pseudomonas sp. ACN5 TaxID=1920427 RepID=UPI000BB2DAAD|nr:universal stress protein [Pseudomonas sp. ACN5]PBJ07659.1 Universal stress protein family protein [Pseudomonas sp. ACN5]